RKWHRPVRIEDSGWRLAEGRGRARHQGCNHDERAQYRSELATKEPATKDLATNDFADAGHCWPRSLRIRSDARRAFAATVSVGALTGAVMWAPVPRINRLGWSWERRLVSTTDVFGSLPIRVVPPMIALER